MLGYGFFMFFKLCFVKELVFYSFSNMWLIIKLNCSRKQKLNLKENKS